MKLNDFEWKDFLLSDLFDICRGNAKGISQKKSGNDVALISAMDSNNGFNKCVNITKGEKIYKNVYTVNNNGNGVCLSYYHVYKFVASTDVTILTPKCLDLSNKYVGLFITSLIKKQKSKFNYGYKMSDKRMEKQKILLPVDEKGIPNWKSIEKYMKEKEHKLLHKYMEYVENCKKVGGGTLISLNNKK